LESEKNHNSIDAITKCIRDAAKFLDDRESILAIYYDLSKGFDASNHTMLLNKLEFHRVRGQALKWFQICLSNRKQYVYYDGQDSVYQL
jgi:hypothetical protein